MQIIGWIGRIGRMVGRAVGLGEAGPRVPTASELQDLAEIAVRQVGHIGLADVEPMLSAEPTLADMRVAIRMHRCRRAYGYLAHSLFARDLLMPDHETVQRAIRAAVIAAEEA